jgi:hypothetical protein
MVTNHPVNFSLPYPISMIKFRFATWQAVSTKNQATVDKVSSTVQLQHCIDAGHTHNWTHVRDYTVPGKSHTQWLSLTVAERNIPELHDMLEAASRHEFDILIIYDLNRVDACARQPLDVCGQQRSDHSRGHAAIPSASASSCTLDTVSNLALSGHIEQKSGVSIDRLAPQEVGGSNPLAPTRKTPEMESFAFN